MKAIQVLSARTVVSCAIVGVAAWFVSGQLSYQVGWKHAAEVHAPLPVGASEWSPEFTGVMMKVHEKMIKEHARGGFASTTR